MMTNTPAKKSTAADRLAKLIRKTRSLANKPFRNQAEQQEYLLAALGNIHRAICLTRISKNKEWRKAVEAAILKHYRTPKLRKPRGAVDELLPVVKVFLPDKTDDNHHNYAAFLAFCCFKKWKIDEVSAEFEKMREQKGGVLSISVLADRGRKLARMKGSPPLGIEIDWDRR